MVRYIRKAERENEKRRSGISILERYMRQGILRSFGRGKGLSLLLAFLSAQALLTKIKVPTWEETLKMSNNSESQIALLIAKLRLMVDGQGLLGLFVVIALTWLFYRFLQKRAEGEYPFKIGVALLSFVFAIIMPAGASIQKFEGLDFLLANRFQIAYGAFLILGWWALLYVSIQMLFTVLDQWTAQKPEDVLAPSKFARVQKRLLDEHPFITPMLVILICWLPYWIAHFPGSIMTDPLRQISQYYGLEPWSNHHPVISSLLYGALMDLGRMLGGYQFGLFVCALFQHLLFSACFAFGLLRMKAWNVRRSIRFALLLFYALFPMIAFWGQSVMKDAAYIALATLFGVLYIDVIRMLKRDEPVKKTLFLAVLVGSVSTMMRHNGLHICALSLMVLALLKTSRKNRKLCLVAAVVFVLGTTLVSNIAIGVVGATEGSKREMLSIPFQQTARYVKEHGDEVTAEERAAIDAVLKYDELAQNYDPDLSDAVKRTYREDDSKLPAYFATWVKMFFKHPITYIEATLCNSYSYYYPYGDIKDIVWQSIHSLHEEEYRFHFVFDATDMRLALRNNLNLITQMPVVGLLCRAGAYTWVLLLMCVYALYRKKGYLALGTVPALLNILVCIVSPVNGYPRYFLPTLLLAPVLVGWMTSEMEESGATA